MPWKEHSVRLNDLTIYLILQFARRRSRGWFVFLYAMMYSMQLFLLAVSLFSVTVLLVTFLPFWGYRYFYPSGGLCLAAFQKDRPLRSHGNVPRMTVRPPRVVQYSTATSVHLYISISIVQYLF